MKSKSPWKTLTSKVIFQNPWLSLRQDDVITPNGKPGTFTLLEAKPFVIIVAIDGTELIMIKQHRYPIDKLVMEFPAGGIETDEETLAAAKRELKEETGYVADQWEYIGEFFELVSISRQQGHLFLARHLHDTGAHKMSEDGIEQLTKITINDLEKMIIDGGIIDALTPAVLLKTKLYLDHTKK